MKIFVLILAVIASRKRDTVENGPQSEERYGANPTLVKIEEDEYAKVHKKYKYIGITYHTCSSKWRAQRWSKDKNRAFSNGYYDDEETAAHASDTLARKFIDNGEQNHKLNFPDDHTEVYPKTDTYSKFVGVSYHKNMSKWCAQRRSKDENKMIYNGYFDNEVTAAHASDTLARKLIKNGEQNHKLNWYDDHTETLFEKREMSSKFIGVTYNKKKQEWKVQRWSKSERMNVLNGHYDDEETAAHASDTLARKLMEKGAQKNKLNFPEDHTEVYSKENQKKRKRQNEISTEHLQNN